MCPLPPRPSFRETENKKRETPKASSSLRPKSVESHGNATHQPALAGLSDVALGFIPGRCRATNLQSGTNSLGGARRVRSHPTTTSCGNRCLRTGLPEAADVPPQIPTPFPSTLNRQPSTLHPMISGPWGRGLPPALRGSRSASGRLRRTATESPSGRPPRSGR
jgi:hypothetical protein